MAGALRSAGSRTWPRWVDGDKYTPPDNWVLNAKICGPTPALGPQSKYLSFAVLEEKPRDNRIAVWEITN